MSVYSIPVTIGVDEERIAQEVTKNVENRVIENITNEVKKIMFEKSYYYGRDLSDEPLRNMVKYEIKRLLADKEDAIIDAAAKELADKLVRTKAVKEKVKEVTTEVFG